MEDLVIVDGFKVNYETCGKGDPLLLIHGMGASHIVWDDICKAASKFYRVIAPDLPGYGASDKPDADYSVNYYVDIVKKLMDALGIQKASVIGLSSGGAVAAMLASSSPERVHRLILVDPAGLTPLVKGVGGLPLMKGILNAAFWLSSKGPGLLAGMSDDLFYDKSKIRESILKERAAIMKDPASRKAFKKLYVSLSRLDSSFPDRLRSIQARTLVAWGRHDRLFPASDEKRFKDAIPKARSVVFERCGHMPPVEVPEDFSREALTFLGEVDLYYDAGEGSKKDAEKGQVKK